MAVASSYYQNDSVGTKWRMVNEQRMCSDSVKLGLQAEDPRQKHDDVEAVNERTTGPIEAAAVVMTMS